MTNELEKKFFDTFGIKPLWHRYLLVDLTTRYRKEKLLSKDEFIDFVKSEKDYLLLKVVPYYRQISDRILLELIRIHYQYLHPFSIYGEKKEFLKNDILECMINILNYFYEHEMGEYSELKHQVRTLFEEG